MSFNGKVAWITGASSGIGEAIARVLHQQGSRLILSSRREDALLSVKDSFEGDTSNVHILPLDLEKNDELPGKAEEALSHYSRIDYLFNNGGISQRSLAMETDIEVVRKLMEVNFFGTITLTKAVLPVMIEQNSGHIIVTSSVVGKFGTQLRSTYAASKHALHGWFDSLRQEVRDHNIKISIVCPGYIKTDVTLNALEGDGSKHGKMGHGQEEGMEPVKFAQKLLPRVLKGEEEIYIGGKEIYAIYLKRYIPGLLYKILSRTGVT